MKSIPTDEFSKLGKGQLIPDFSWNDEYGSTLRSIDLKGQFILIVLFSDVCPHCKENFSFLNNELDSEDINKIKIACFGRDCDNEKIEIYRQNQKLNLPLFPDPEGEIYKKFAIKAVPRTILFDKKSRLLSSIRGYRPFELKNLLQITR